MNSTHNKTVEMSGPQSIQQAARNQESKTALLECCAVFETFSVARLSSRSTLRVEEFRLDVARLSESRKHGLTSLDSPSREIMA